ncbi:hypothetical protein HUJ05_011116 [Dendroctonus ponderosae]|nr:hypothetical protein HUJ05_011116 [Dendroctonus ponderosae]
MGAERQSANRLYLRFPVKIADEHQILSLHPKIALVRLPRQKSRRWCIIECASQTDLEEVRGCLKRLKVDGKSLKMRQFIGNPYELELESDEDMEELDEEAVGATIILNTDYTELNTQELQLLQDARPDSVASDPDFDPTDSEVDSMSYYSDQASWVEALAFSSDEGDLDDDSDGDWEDDESSPPDGPGHQQPH